MPSRAIIDHVSDEFRDSKHQYSSRAFYEFNDDDSNDSENKNAGEFVEDVDIKPRLSMSLKRKESLKLRR